MEQELNYQDIQKKLPASFPPIWKACSIDQARRDINMLNLTKEQKDDLSKLGGRELGHVYRLVQRPGVEREFGLALLSNESRKLLAEKEGSQGRSVINSEGHKTTNFWTFSPYIFKELTDKGLTIRQALVVLLQWAQSSHRLLSNEGRKSGKTNLKGLEHLNKGFRNFFILPIDPSHIAHQYAAQTAKKIVALLLTPNPQQTKT
jgi:hypothetical protein